MNKIHVFIPHRWNKEDYEDLSFLLDRTKFSIVDYSIPKTDPLDSIDRRYNVDPQIQNQIKHASIVVCSNRPANNGGVAIEEIKYAHAIGKPIIAVQLTYNTSSYIKDLNIPVVANRKDSLEKKIMEII